MSTRPVAHAAAQLPTKCAAPTCSDKAPPPIRSRKLSTIACASSAPPHARRCSRVGGSILGRGPRWPLALPARRRGAALGGLLESLACLGKDLVEVSAPH